MSTQDYTKPQNILWWIASIATSVVCCALLFIFFASYMVELRTTARDNNVRIDVIQQQETQILHELEQIRKHAEGATPASDASSATVPAPDAAISIVPPAALATPDAQAPHVEVPVVTPPAEKK